MGKLSFYFRGLPRFANEIPPASAALRSSRAFFKASIFSRPLGIDRAASKSFIGFYP
ncbi:hypothetical protein [Bradyrhizobium sp. AZCC 2289]|uniref:hypothetical protein n=1 Tax=Bradyrhizobium sp. AZCC 2289 TaxID=3117026 RepID=UPI002FEF1155